MLRQIWIWIERVRDSVERDDKIYLCIDSKINADYLIGCVDAILMFDVECAGFSPYYS